MFGIIGIIGGIATTIYANQIINNIGDIDAFESTFGAGSSTFVLKIAGLIVSFASFMYLMGAFDGAETVINQGI